MSTSHGLPSQCFRTNRERKEQHKKLTNVGYNGEIPAKHMNTVPVEITLSSRT